MSTFTTKRTLNFDESENVSFSWIILTIIQLKLKEFIIFDFRWVIETKDEFQKVLNHADT